MLSPKMKNRDFSGTINSELTKREADNRQVARKAAAEGMVLLKNENLILPLAPGSNVALYGIGASKTIKGGTGSGDVNERDSVSIYQGMKNAGYVITNEEWVADFDQKFQEARLVWRDLILEKSAGKQRGSKEFFSIYTSNPFIIPLGKTVEKTETDTAFYILSRVAGEGADRFAKKGDYFLAEEEERMLDDICQYYEKVVVVVNTGGLVDLSFLDKYNNIYGLIQMVQPGMEGGNAFADLVSGNINASGKLTDSWAYDYNHYPNAENFSHNNGDVENESYEEGIYVGYRYFDSFDVPVRYSFGYGISYTDFKIVVKDVIISQVNESAITIKAEVTNVGSVFSGKEVIQVYVSCPIGKLEKEYRRLVAFGKTKELKTGESQVIKLTVPVYQLASYDELEPGWILEEGFYGIWIGNSLAGAKIAAAIYLDTHTVLEKTENICPLQGKLREYHVNEEKQICRYYTWLQELKDKHMPLLNLEAEALNTKVIVYKKNKELVTEKAKTFVKTLTIEQLIELSAGDPVKAQGGNLGAAGKSVPGSAGETHSCAVEQNLASIVLADGPAGIRLMQYYHVHEGEIVSMPFQFSLEGGLFCPDADKLPGERYYQYCTSIPVGTLLAQTWNVELLEEVGEMIGSEMNTFGVTLWLAPGMNIHRNPLCGRNFEYYSEDPFLSGSMASAITKGVQKVPGCGTTIKHFACNNQEDNRKKSDSILSERTLREIYLRGFEIAIKSSQPMSMMTSYNRINGVHAANNYDICTKVARCEWGFNGMIVTDWTTTEMDDMCTAAGCMRAGNDLIMPGCMADHNNLQSELAAGTLDAEDLKACISRLVEIIWQSNQYEGAVAYHSSLDYRCRKIK